MTPNSLYSWGWSLNPEYLPLHPKRRSRLMHCDTAFAHILCFSENWFHYVAQDGLWLGAILLH